MINKILRIVDELVEKLDDSFNNLETNKMNKKEYLIYTESCISDCEKSLSKETLDKVIDSLSIFGYSDDGVLLSYNFLEAMKSHLDNNFINILENILAENSNLPSLVQNVFPKPFRRIEGEGYYLQGIELELKLKRYPFLSTIYSPLKNVIGHTSSTKSLNSFLIDGDERFDFNFEDFRRNIVLLSKIIFLYPRHATYFKYDIDDRFSSILDKAEKITDSYLNKLEVYHPTSLKRIHSLLSSKSIVRIMYNINKGIPYRDDVEKFKQDLFLLSTSSQMETSFIPPSKVANDLTKLILFVPELARSDTEIRSTYQRMVTKALNLYIPIVNALSSSNLVKYFEEDTYRILPRELRDNYLTLNAAMNAGAYFNTFQSRTYNVRKSYLNFISYFSFRYKKIFNNNEDFKKIPDVNLNKIFF